METTIAAPASAPAAAPSAPSSSAPATPAPATPTPAPAPAPAAAPAAPAEERSMEERLAQGWKQAQESVPLEEEADDAPPADAPPADAAPAADAVPDPDAAADPNSPDPDAPPADAAPAAEAFDWDDGTIADPAVLASELKKDPAAQKFFEERPELKGQIYGALRRDKENREIRAYIPDVETAKMVTGAAETFQKIDNRFLQATTPEGAQEFLNHWIQEAMYFDDKGEPVRDEKGQYKLHPALEYTFDHIAGNKLKVFAGQVQKDGKLPQQLAPIVDALRSFAVTKGDERLQLAVDVLKEVLTPPSSGSEEVPDALKPYADSLKAKETALNQKERDDAARQQREQHEAHLQSIERSESKAADAMKAQLKPRFVASGLTEFEQKSAMSVIGDEIDSALGQMLKDGSWTKGTHPSSGMFQQLYNSIIQNTPPGEAREKRLTKHLMTYTQQIIGPITAKVIREAKQGTLDRQADKQATVDSQKRNSAPDPRGTSIAPSSPQPQTPAQMRAQIVEEYKAAHGGEEPEMSWVMAEAFKRQNAPKR